VLLDASDPWLRWDWLSLHLPDIWADLVEHVELTVIAVAGGLLIALPLGVAAYRSNFLREPLLASAGVLYAIPSLALLSFLVPFTGLTVVTAEIGLISYTLLILLRNVVVGLNGVPFDVRDAASGMGFRPFAQLLRVELPLAVPAILAGVRIATVTTIGLVTITALIGEGGLGRLILDGLIRDFKSPLLVGTVLSILLALGADLTLAAVQRRLTPWARR
jgi:osmoprotectant transport system permease protein